MLELLFQGLIEWIYGLILEAWEYFSSTLLDIMSMDFAYLEDHIAVLPYMRHILLAVGWALLIGNLVFQATKSMVSGLGFEGEDPKLLFTRTFVFAFLLSSSKQICDLLLNMTSMAMDVIKIPSAVSIHLADDAAFGGIDAAWLLIIICGIIVMFQSFKLIFEMAERYFILAMLTVSAPLAFGMGGSRNTSDIFSGWCRMYGSMCLLMVLNVVFVKLLLSVLSYIPSGLDVLPWMVLVLTIVKVAKKADAIITRIGLNPAITGDSMGRSFPGTLTYIVARSAVSNVVKTLGKGNAANGGGKAPSAPPPGMGGAGSGNAGSYNANARGGKAQPAGNPSAAHQSSSNTSSQQSTAQQEETQQNASAQYNTQNAGKESAGGTKSTNQVFQGAPAGKAPSGDRKTSVPPGTRRSPTHVKSPPVSGTPNAATPAGAVPRAGETARAGDIRGATSSSASPDTARAQNPGSGETRKSSVPRPVVAGTPSAASADTRKGTAQSNGTAGTQQASGETRRSAAPHPGMAGSGIKPSSDQRANGPSSAALHNGPNAVSEQRTSMPRSGMAGTASTTNGEQRTTIPRSGMAETGAKADAERRTTIPRPGTAGTPKATAGSTTTTVMRGNPKAPKLTGAGGRPVSSSGTAGIAKTPGDAARPRSDGADTAHPVAERKTAARNGTAGSAPSVSQTTQITNAGSRFSQSNETRRADAAPSGTAGTAQSVQNGSRLTNVGAPGSHSSVVNSNVQAKEQNGISVNQKHADAAGIGGSGTAASPSFANRRAKTPSEGTRSTQRPPAKSPAATTEGRRPPAAEASSSQSAASREQPDLQRSGMAGIASQESTRQTAREPRHGRNGMPVPAERQSEKRTPQTAQQEQASKRTDPRAPGKAPGDVKRPGMAGTGPQSAQVSQARQTARSQAAKSHITPAATGAPGGKKMKSAASNAPRKTHQRPAVMKSESKDTFAGGRTTGHDK